MAPRDLLSSDSEATVVGLSRACRCLARHAPLWAWLALSCTPLDDSGAAPPTVSRRDSAGVQLVHSLSPAWDAGGAWSVDAVPEVTIGSSPDRSASGDTEEEIPLERVAGVAVLSDGRIVVADAGSARVMVFDGEGRLVHQFGGRGQGPGEIPVLLGLHTCTGDSIVVASRSHHLVFDDDGRFVRQARNAGGGNFFSALSSDCGRVLTERIGAGPPLGEWGLRDNVFEWWDPLLEVSEAVTSAHLLEAWSRQLYGEQRNLIVPWGTLRSTHAVHDDQLVLGYGRSPELRTYGPTGSLRSVVTWSREPDPVTRADRRRYSDTRLTWLKSMPDDPEVRFLFPELGEFPGLPDSKPLFDRVLVDDEAGVWIRTLHPESLGPFDSRVPDLAASRSETWTVFDSTGVWLGDLALPERFNLKIVARGRVIGVAIDTFNVQTVRAFRVVRPSD